MFYLYVLKNIKGKYYIGYSSDLRQRFSHHNAGRVTATKHGRPWILHYYEAYQEKICAEDRERKLKQRGRAWQELKKRIV